MGLDTDRFPDELLPELICKICRKVVELPIECSKCQQSFCKPCMQHWQEENKQCPNSCTAPLRQSHPILMSYLNTLKVRCIYASRGCTAVVTVKDLNTHELTECERRLVTCPNEGCEEQFEPAQPHLEECIHGLTACEVCGFQLKKCLLESHRCVSSIVTLIQDLSQQAKRSYSQLCELQTLVKASDVNGCKHEGTQCSKCKRQNIVGVLNLCLSCPDSTFCWKCSSWHQHEQANFVQLEKPGIHEAVICDGCHATNIQNFRFKCKTCDDFGKQLHRLLLAMQSANEPSKPRIRSSHPIHNRC